MKAPVLRALATALTLNAAMPGQAANFMLEEITVTAQKRSENVQDVPVAISAFTNEMVVNTGADEISDLMPLVPGLTGSTTSASVSSFALRGITTNDFSIAAEPSVATFIDDAYIGRNQLSTAAFFDVERIEVVKGPQGTLFGRNAVGGAINISTNKPVYENEFALGSYAGNEGQVGADVVGNVAATGNLAFRAAYHGTTLDGIYEDLSQGKKAGKDSDAVRASMLWQATDNVEVLAVANWSDTSFRLVGGSYSPDLQPLNDEPGASEGQWPDKVRQSGEDVEDTETNGLHLRVTWDLNDSLTLTSITDRRSFDMWFTQDADGSEADDYLAWALGLQGDAPTPIANVGVSLQFDQDTDQDSISQEFRLNGSSDRFDWFVGASYFKEELEERIFLSAVDIDGAIFGAGPRFRVSDSSFGKGETTSYGIYGDMTYHMTEILSVTAGARWSMDEKDWCASGVDALGFGFVDTAGEIICDDDSWSEVTPRLVVDYSIAEDIMFYASLSQGYKGGGFNTTTTGTEMIGFDPETVASYELGAKGDYFDGAVRANIALFFNDYEDLQILSANLSGIAISNAAQAETEGVEIDFTWTVTDNLVLIGNYAYVNAEFQSGLFTNAYGENINLKGNSMPFAPQNTYSVAAAYDVAFGSGAVSLFTSYNWTDKVFFSADNAKNTTQDSYGLWNAKATYRAVSERWDIYLAADNILDEEYANLFQDIGLGTQNVYRANPRLVKVGFNIYF